MSDITSLHTPTAAGTSPKSTGPLGTTIPGAAGNFLDLLMGALLPLGAQIVSVHTPQETALGTTPKDTSLLTPVIADEQIVIPTDKGLESPVDSPMTMALMATSPVINDIDAQAVIPTPTLGTTPDSLSDKTSNFPAPLQAQMTAQDPMTTPEGEPQQLTPTFSPVKLSKNTDIIPDETLNDPTLAQSKAQSASLLESSKTLPDPMTRHLAAQLNAISTGDQQQQKTSRGDKSTDILSTLLTKQPANDLGYVGNLGGRAVSYDALSTMQNTAPAALRPASTANTIVLPEGTDATTTDSLFDLAPPTDLDGINPAPIQTTTPTAQHTTSVSTTQGASSHASVQAVALHLQQLAQNRETRSLTLQLNPPELGRMQVKMTYGRDKSVKADILVEKSDTFNLMKSDAHTLRDALSNAGLQADSASLNFSLADQGTFTERDHTGEARAHGNRANSIGDDVIGAIEIRSSEEWSVDPRTGIVRYNIIV